MRRFLISCLILFSLQLYAQFQFDRRNVYEPDDWVSYPVTRFMTSVTVDLETVYFGTTNGILTYDIMQNKWGKVHTYSDGLVNDRIKHVCFDERTGFLWAVQEKGVSHLVPAGQRWENHTFDYPVHRIGIGDKYLWIMSQGDYYIGSIHGQNFKESNKEFAVVDKVNWHGSFAKRDVDLPLDFFLPNGYTYNSETGFMDSRMHQYPISDFLIDRYDNLWIATSGMGAGKADARILQIEFLQQGPFADGTRVMAWDPPGMWMGGHTSDMRNGVTWWDYEYDEWLYFEAVDFQRLRDDKIRAIMPYKHFVWFATTDGLARYDINQNRWRTFTVHSNLISDNITCLALDNETLWVGTDNGINKVHALSGVIKQIDFKSLKHRMVYAIAVQDNDVWAGTEQGIVHFNSNEKTWAFNQGHGSVMALEITAVSAWENEVWFGSSDGLEMYDSESDTWKGFLAHQYNLETPVHAIYADKNVVWIGTDSGVYKYVKAEHRFHQYTTMDGLLDNRVTWIVPEKDHVWFATAGGLTRFYWNAPHRVD